MLWFVDDQGQLSAVRVRTGLSDGTMTQVEGRGLEDGMQLIAGVTISEDGPAANPFQQSAPTRRGPGGF